MEENFTAGYIMTKTIKFSKEKNMMNLGKDVIIFNKSFILIGFSVNYIVKPL